MVAVNLTAPILIAARDAGPIKRGAAIVGVSSTAVLYGSPGEYPDDAATKNRSGVFKGFALEHGLPEASGRPA